MTHERIRKSGECLLCDQLCEWGIKMGGVECVFWGASREARGRGGVIANESEAIQLMFGCSRLCSTRVLNQPARPSPDTSWIASLPLAMTGPGLSSRACEAIQLMFGCSRLCPTRLLNQPARPSPDTSWIASLPLAMTGPGLSSRACEAIQLMFGCFRLCTTRVLNQPARPSPDISWIASLSLAMTVMIEYLFVPMPSTILPVRLWNWGARFA